MISQQEALDLTTKAQKDSLDATMKALGFQITTAASNGKYEVPIDKMNPILKEELRKLGYNVYTDPQGNWKVGWKKSV